MKIRDFEDLIRTQINDVVLQIIADNKCLPISAQSRAGAEISDGIEKYFVEATRNHPYLKNSESAPKGKTKNPWDARTFFTYSNYQEEIWIDFKAFKLSSEDSNPDIGTPDKVIKFIQNGGFYLLYVYVYYEEHGNGLRFIKNTNNEFIKSYFLKDISPTFRRTPTNQLQVNISAEPIYRTRDEFIELLMEKCREGLERQKDKAETKLQSIDDIKSRLKKCNSDLEQVIEQTLR